MQFRREPALWLALIASLIQVVSAFVLPLTVEQQGVLNAVAVAGAGLLTAALVRTDQMAPAILGFVQAAVAVGLAFGWQLAAENQAVLMAAAAAVVGMFVRTQVSVSEPPTIKEVTREEGAHAA